MITVNKETQNYETSEITLNWSTVCLTDLDHGSEMIILTTLIVSVVFIGGWGPGGGSKS